MANIEAIGCVSMNPVFSITSESSSSSKSFQSLPEFELQGSEIVVKLADQDSYNTLDSGIMYEDVDLGNIKGQTLCYKHQQINLNYNLYGHRGHIKSTNFNGTPTILSTDLGAECFAKALDGMKPGGKRRIILPPKVTSFGEYRVVDVTLNVVEKPGSLSNNHLLKLPISQLYDVTSAKGLRIQNLETVKPQKYYRSLRLNWE
ncbi:hypothetical protein ACFE04_026321 [Oxalis oulophora]